MEYCKMKTFPITIVSLYLFTSCVTEETRRIDEFWTWFETEQNDLLIESREVGKWNRGIEILKGLHEDISVSPNKPKENGGRALIFSVNWNKDAIPIVKKIVDRKPNLNKWDVKAFHEDLVGGALVFMEDDTGLAISTHDVFYSYDRIGQELEFQFFVEEYHDDSKDLKEMVSSLIYGEIGELNAVHYIRKLNLNELDSNAQTNLIPLRSLDKTIEKIKQ